MSNNKLLSHSIYIFYLRQNGRHFTFTFILFDFSKRKTSKGWAYMQREWVNERIGMRVEYNKSWNKNRMNRKTKVRFFDQNTERVKSIHWEFQWNIFYVHKNVIKKKGTKRRHVHSKWKKKKKKSNTRTHKIVCFLEKGFLMNFTNNFTHAYAYAYAHNVLLYTFCILWKEKGMKCAHELHPLQAYFTRFSLTN